MKRVEERQRRPRGAILDSIADIFDCVGGMQKKSAYRGLLLELTKVWSLCSTVIDEVQKSAPLNCIAGVVQIFFLQHRCMNSQVENEELFFSTVAFMRHWRLGA